MPKIVDHDQRRSELARHVIAVISREGIAKATMREIAREAGFTSGILSHYFTSKEEMVKFAFNAVAEQIYVRIDQGLKSARGARQQLRVVIEELLPIDAGDEESVVSIVFWASAVHDASLRQQFKQRYDQWRGYVHRILQQAARNGEIDPPFPLQDLTDLLISVTDGLLVSWILQPGRQTKTARRKLIDQLLSLAGLQNIPHSGV